MKYLLLVFLLSVCLFSQCSPPKKSGSKELKVLKISLLPTDNADNMKRRYLPLINYLSKKLNIPHTVTIPGSYEEHLALFKDKKINLALFGGYTFVKASNDFNARPLVIRDIDLEYSSFFLVRRESKARSIRDLKGGKLAFGPKLSTSGHLMPRQFLMKKRIRPEGFFSEIRYSASHDQSLKLLSERKVELVAVDFIRAQQAILGFRKGRGFARVLAQTKHYTDYVWAIQGEYSEEWITRVRDAFMDLSQEDPAEARILKDLNAKYYLPAGESDFSAIREILFFTGKN
ncbi:MAG: phosphate/phosphite/phosphonate ABC transporter substrate-binding protein [Spirochaetota bacterium]|nr:phosphate/phosphite/phosphonate ABC transporter substrate-binding protein [Spirochaetota bacterium]